MAVSAVLVFNDDDEAEYFEVEQDVTLRIPVEDTISYDWKEPEIPKQINELLQINYKREHPIQNPQIVELSDGSDSPTVAIVSQEMYEALTKYL